MDYPAYLVYRKSGIEWLGDIPDHWELKKFRFLFSFGRGLGITKENLLDEGIPCINYGEIHSKYGFEVIPEKHPLKCVTPDYLETGTSSLLSVGDFVFADTSEDIEGSGNFSHLNSDTPTFAGYHTVIARSISNDVPRYMAYLFDSLPYRFQIRKTVSGVKVFSITQAILKNCYLWLPQKTEQIQIAQFLDHKTQQIDQLLAKKQTLIDKLNEQRIALITHAVTKGLNPDVTLKDSGVEWLGKVPKHWQVRRVRFLVEKIEQGWSPQCFNYPAEDDSWGVLKVGCVNSNYFDPMENKELPEEMEIRPEYEIKSGDILISRANTKELLGSAALVPNNVRSRLLLCDKLYKLISNKELLNEFFILFLRSFATRPHYEREATGASGSMQNIGQDTVKNLPVTVPPYAEQAQIVEYLDKETARIDRMVELNQQTMDKLKEYRTALITAAVTGKIDVRNWQQESNHANP